ncbi:MAG: NTP transferase domain-containing protein [Ardenticatenaceae bacterium]|nr:NTP transferase domain-containing protein [Ardenticatenaceae bacterium]
MDAIVIAGGIPHVDHPLYHLTQGRPKAMLDMGGRPMIEWVLFALNQADQIEDVIVVGLDDPADQERLDKRSVATFIPNQGSLVANGMAGLRWLRRHKSQSKVVVGCSSDIPHIEGHMIDALIDLCRPFDRLFYYPVISRKKVETVYPQARRTYTRFKGGVEVAGADIFVLQTAFLDTDHQLWEKLTNARKSPLQVARLIGFLTLFKLVFGQLSLAEAAATGGRILSSDRPIGIVFPDHPELAMDGDKPHQVRILRERFKD